MLLLDQIVQLFNKTAVFEDHQVGMENGSIFLGKLVGDPFFQIERLDAGFPQGFVEPFDLRSGVNIVLIKDISEEKAKEELEKIIEGQN